jgi:hypothetical protein
MQKSLDQKIADLRANPSGSKAFIIADAKDADMAFGITAPGQKRPLNPERVLKSEMRWKTLPEYHPWAVELESGDFCTRSTHPVSWTCNRGTRIGVVPPSKDNPWMVMLPTDELMAVKAIYR